MDDFDKTLIKIIENEHPESLEEAVRLVRLRFPESQASIIERILCLESERKISFENSSISGPASLSEYFFSDRAHWFWRVFSLTVVTLIFVLVVPDDSFPLVYVRTGFSLILVLLLPGYSLIRALFSSKELDDIERFTLSIGLSLALVTFAGLFLNFTPWGIRTTPVTFCLFAFTLVFASASVMRDYVQAPKKETITL